MQVLTAAASHAHTHVMYTSVLLWYKLSPHHADCLCNSLVSLLCASHLRCSGFSTASCTAAAAALAAAAAAAAAASVGVFAAASCCCAVCTAALALTA
jgi:hypothetical protein